MLKNGKSTVATLTLAKAAGAEGRVVKLYETALLTVPASATDTARSTNHDLYGKNDRHRPRFGPDRYCLHWRNRSNLTDISVA